MDEGLDFATEKGSLPRTDGILNLSPGEAQAYLARGAVMVDIREAYETNFRVFDIDEVLYLPWTRFGSGMGSLPHDRPLVIADAAGIYCREAARLLTEAGYSNIAKLSGGMIDWDSWHFPVRKDEDFELRGECACKMKTRHGGSPLIDKNSRANYESTDRSISN